MLHKRLGRKLTHVMIMEMIAEHICTNIYTPSHRDTYLHSSLPFTSIEGERRRLEGEGEEEGERGRGKEREGGGREREREREGEGEGEGEGGGRE